MSTLIIHSATLYDGSIGGTTDDGALRIEDGTITHVGTTGDSRTWPSDGAEIIDAGGAPVVPGYIDVHHHGGGGVAFDDGPEATVRALAEHAAHGTTRAVLSYVTDSLDLMEKRIRDGAAIVRDNPRVIGLHPEGPFLDPGHKGAHPEHELKDPTDENVRRLLDAGEGTIVQMTIAPERNNGTEAVRMLVDNGVVAAVGHTDASYETAREAFDNGATQLTHAFNGMNGIHHRAPGPVVAALRDDRVWIEIINDGIHVHPQVVRSLFLEAPQRVVLVTDAMSATCNPDGDYMLGQLKVKVRDGIARLAEGGSLAGSTLTMDLAVANAVRKVGVPLDVAVAAATGHAARCIRMDDRFGRLAVGYPGDVLILDAETLLPTRIWADGEAVEPA
ncbi:N-acetylglucosamine-6-phosphate deacetylase [Corynebacterium sp. P7202]|uniref:N-acetylglucosamine-6-phosphate deacetylase n=1 Tax=Corynebacterium pygosceleis TaxID=2800406 RepID=A0A9Q4CB51_9CORY|nr:N-acetylglucosamine-6-phosphate deacetylase [Corynebacterium pygosceleis]MCK7638262.1 N-acetylglucosamine-6-phosphate deacetylase [Corynebacterium pygosceleis]MCX7445623.1 N-acetylglucosamine-6-phosphate deacetylase [Corynebacterium pygosceleis]MCX7468923.1 N-acetylglucosamine-6-phosphate deacetylase [Corynebacterium pygosceleis]